MFLYFHFPLFEKGCFHQLECLTRVIYIPLVSRAKACDGCLLWGSFLLVFLCSKWLVANKHSNKVEHLPSNKCPLSLSQNFLEGGTGRKGKVKDCIYSLATETKSDHVYWFLSINRHEKVQEILTHASRYAFERGFYSALKLSYCKIKNQTKQSKTFVYTQWHRYIPNKREGGNSAPIIFFCSQIIILKDRFYTNY